MNTETGRHVSEGGKFVRGCHGSPNYRMGETLSTRGILNLLSDL
jgi:hypothetical protein